MIPLVNGVAGGITHTSSATPTVIKQIPVPQGTTVTIYGLVVTGQNLSGIQNVFIRTQQLVVFSNTMGLAEQTAAIAAVVTDPRSLGYSVSLVPNGNFVDVTVTGAASNEVDWSVWAERVEMTTDVFVPTDISGLLLWFRADLLVTKDGSNRISSWGNLANTTFCSAIVQATAGNKPLWVASGINGRPAVEFLFTRPDFLRSAFGSNLSQPGDIFFVQRPNALRVSFILDSAGSGNRWQILQEADGTFDLNAGSNINGGASAVGTSEVFEGKVNGASGEILQNGASVAAGAVGANTFDGMTLGASRTDALGADTRIGEFLMWNSILTAPQRAQVMAYLRAGWGTP